LSCSAALIASTICCISFLPPERDQTCRVRLCSAPSSLPVLQSRITLWPRVMNRLVGVVLEQELHALGSARGNTLAERARHHQVVAEIDLAEQAGIAGEGAVGLDLLEVDRRELRLALGQGFAEALQHLFAFIYPRLVIAGLVPAIQLGVAETPYWMPGTRLVLGPAKPDPSAGHDALIADEQKQAHPRRQGRRAN